MQLNLRRSLTTATASQQQAALATEDSIGDPLADPLERVGSADIAPVAPPPVEVKEEDDDAPDGGPDDTDTSQLDAGGAAPSEGPGGTSRPSGGGDVSMHQTLAEATAEKLEDAESVGDLRDRADALEAAAGQVLEPGIGMTITLGARGADDGVDATVRIAPNDTIFSRRVVIAVPDGSSDRAKELIGLVNAALGERRAKKGATEAKTNTALGVVMTLAGEPTGVRTEVVAACGADLLELFEKARLTNLWKNPDAATAVVTIIKSCPPTAAVSLIHELLTWHPLDFDLQVDRWEARLAWELLNILPKDQRTALLNDDLVGDTKKEVRQHHAKAKGTNKIEKNLSKEYKESRRYSTFEGNERPDDVAATEPGAADPAVDGKGNDTARELLLIRAFDPKLWTGGNPDLGPTLKMVLIAKEESQVASLVSGHWSQNEEVLRGLGFHASGAYGEQIEDKTATNWVERTVAGLRAAWDLLGLVMAALSNDAVKTLDLAQIETALMQRFGGVYLDHSTDQETKLDIAETIFTTLGITKTVLNALGVAPIQFLDMLLLGKSIADKIDKTRLARLTVEQLTNDDASDDPEVAPNKLLVAKDKTGHTVMKIGMLPVAAQVAIFGDTTVKTGACLLLNAVVEIKSPTVADGTTSARVRVAGAALTNVQIITQDDITLIDSITVNALDFDLEGEVSEPASLFGRIATDIMQTMMTVFQFMPSGGIVGGVGEAISNGFPLAAAAMDLSDGKFRQVGFSFGGASVQGVHSASGMAVDEVTIGATEVTFQQPSMTQFEHQTRDELLATQKDLKAKAAGYAKKLNAERKPTGKSLTVLEEQAAWTADALAWIEHRLPIIDQVRALQDKVKQLTEERDALANTLSKNSKQFARDNSDGRRLTYEWRKTRSDEKELCKGDVEAKEAEIAAAEQELMLLEGFAVQGVVGKVDLKGASMSGMSVGSATLEQTSVSTTSTTEVDAQGAVKETTHITAVSAGLELKDVELGGAARRDELVRKTLNDLDELMAPLLEAEGGKGTFGPAEKARLAAARKAQAAAQAELAMLEPAAEEYELLRARLTAKASPASDVKPLSESEKSRLVQLRDLISAPPSTTIEHVVAAGLTVAVNLDPTTLDDKPGAIAKKANASMKVDQLTVSNVTQTGDGPGAGNTTIGSVSATGAELSFDGKGLSVKAPDLVVADVTMEGTGVAGERRRAQLEKQVADIHARLAALEGSEDGEAERKLLHKQLSVAQAELKKLDEAEGEGPRMDKLMGELDARAAKMIDLAGVNRSTAFSFEAANDAMAAINGAIFDVDYGPKDKQGQPGVMCLSEARRLVQQYTAGLKAVDAKLAAIKKQRDPKNVTQRSAAHFSAREEDELKAVRAAALAEQATWSAGLKGLLVERTRLSVRLNDMDRIRGLYSEVMELVSAYGLDLRAFGIASTTTYSAAQLRAAAVAQRDRRSDMTIGSVQVSGVDLQIDGVLALLNTDPTTAALDEVTTLHGGGGGDAMVGELKVSNVKQGDQTLLESLDVKGVGGKVTVLGTGHYRIDDLKIGDVELGAVNWESSSQGLHTDGPVTLSQLSVSAELDGSPGKDIARIDSFKIGAIRSSKIDYRYGDYLVHLGSVDGKGKGELAAVEVSNFDMNTFAFGGVSLNGLNTTDLAVDLGGGMKLNAQKLNAGSLKVGSVVSGAEQKKAEGENRYGSADAYTFDVNGVDAEKLKFSMEGMGVNVEKLSDADLGKITFDMTTGAFSFAKMKVGAVKLGAFGYAADGMKIDMASADLTAVEVSGSGKMLFDADEKKKLDDADKHRVPDSIQSMNLDFSAETATLNQLHYVSKAAGAEQNIFVKQAKAKGLALKGYDYKTGKMKLSAHGASVGGLDAKLADALGSTQLTGGFNIGSLGVDMFEDESMNLSLAGLTNKGDVKVLLTPKNLDKDKPGTSTTATTVDKIDNLSANLSMKGDAWKEGASTSFSDVKLGSLGLANLTVYTTGSSAFGSLLAKGVKLDAIGVSGNTTTKMVEQHGMMLPETTLNITTLSIGALTAQDLFLDDFAVVEDKGGGKKLEALSSYKPGAGPAVQIKDLAITDLTSVSGGEADGVKNGRITASSAQLNAGVDTTLKSRLPGFVAGGALNASGLFVNILDDGKTIQGGLSEVLAKDVKFTLRDDNGGTIDVDAPAARLKDVSATTITSDDSDTLFSAGTFAHVGQLDVLQNADVVWTRKDDGATQYTDEERSLASRKAEINNLSPGGKQHQPTEDKAKTLDSINVSGLLGTISGNLSATVKMSDWLYGSLNVGVSKGKVTRAEVDLSALIDIIGLGLAPIAYETLLFTIESLGKGVDLRVFTQMLKDQLAPHAATAQKKLREALQSDVDGQETTAEWLAGFTVISPLTDPSQSALEERYDKSANKKRGARDQKLKTLEAMLAKYGSRFGSAAQASLRDYMDRVRQGTDEGDSFDLWVDQLDAHLTAGPWTTNIDQFEAGKKVSNSVLSIGSIGLEMQDVGKGVYNADIDMKSVGFANTTTDGKNQEVTNVSAGEIDLNTKGTQLFPHGKLAFKSTKGGGMIANPVKATLEAGSKVLDLNVMSAKHYKKS